LLWYIVMDLLYNILYNSASPRHPFVGTRSKSWDVNMHTARCTSPVSVVWQCKLVSGWGLKKTEISAVLWFLRLGKDFTFLCCKTSYTNQHHSKVYSKSTASWQWCKAFAGTHCAYPRRDGQAELTWVAWLHTKIVYPPADGHPSNYQLGLALINLVDATNDVINWAKPPPWIEWLIDRNRSCGLKLRSES